MGDAYGAGIIEVMSKNDLQILPREEYSKNRLNDSTSDVTVLAT